MNRKRPVNQTTPGIGKVLEDTILSSTPSKKIRWDTAKTASLIEHYQCHDYLWNPKAPDYKNDEKRRKSIEQWLEVNQLEKELVHEVKVKLHGLRTSFGQQLKLEMVNAQKQAVVNYGGNEQPPQSTESKWQWYRHLSFLKDAVTFRGSIVPKTEEFEHSVSLSSAGEFSNHDHDEKNSEIEKVLNDQAMHQYPTNFVTLDHSANYQMDGLHSIPMATAIHVHDQIIHNNGESNDMNSYHTHSTTMSTPTTSTVKHITSIGSSQTNDFIIAADSNKRYSNGTNNGNGMSPAHNCSTNCFERQRDSPGDKLGRLVTETFNNLHPEYQEMARMEIHQLLGKYLQKPIPTSILQ